jgi:MYXO-CTERM domain-containing protein
MVKHYLYLFVKNAADLPDGQVIENAFTAAAFLANEAWFLNDYYGDLRLTVSYDFGADTNVPEMSRAGMIIISILLGLDLVCLFGLALYSVAWMPRWTERLDAFAMMRIGAAVACDSPLLVADDMDRIVSLDETPGWIGEVTDSNLERESEDDESLKDAAVWTLGLGALGPIRRRRKYRAYDSVPNAES